MSQVPCPHCRGTGRTYTVFGWDGNMDWFGVAFVLALFQGWIAGLLAKWDGQSAITINRAQILGAIAGFVIGFVMFRSDRKRKKS